MRPQCIICGRKINLDRYELPNGTFHICRFKRCKEHLTLKINDCAPIVWLDLSAYEEGDNTKLTSEEIKALKPQDIFDIVDFFKDQLTDYFWDDYSNILDNAVDAWKEYREEQHIKTCPKKDLPLLLNTIQFQNNILFYEKRLKEK